MSEAWKDLGGGIIPFPKAKAQPKGRRWGDDEIVPAQWVFDGHVLRKQHKLPRIDLNLEALKFANYWASATGKNASKLDWKRTWMNWVVSARGVPEQEPAAPVYTATDNDRRLIELALKGVRTMSFGPDLVRRAREKGICTEEEARKLGY